MGEEDSQFMKVAKKLTAKKLQKKGEHWCRTCSVSHEDLILYLSL